MLKTATDSPSSSSAGVDPPSTGWVTIPDRVLISRGLSPLARCQPLRDDATQEVSYESHRPRRSSRGEIL